jgi:SpoVK/Ycf46/Vps4 family AAA+-type ATPase
MDEHAFFPSHLGIDDLVVALRPGRSAEAIIDALEKLDLANWAAAKAEEQDEDKDASGKGGSSSSKSKKKSETSFDIIEPVKLVDAKRGSLTSANDRSLLLEELPGYGEARDWAFNLKADLALWREGLLGWSEMSTKLLLSGPPGTGKTTFAKALCNSLQVPMLATSVAQWLEPGYLGDVLKLMASAFETAAKRKPAILFIDEVDGIGRRGDSSRSYSDYWDSFVNRALELVDGAGKSEGVIVVGATNHPEKIDPALRRSGRLEQHAVIPLPDTEALTGILAYHLGSDVKAIIDSRPAKKEKVAPMTIEGRIRQHGKSAGHSSPDINKTMKGTRP